jgi:ribosomal protein S8
MMSDTLKKIRGAMGFSSPFAIQQFSKTRFSVVTCLCRAGYFAENRVSKTSAKGGFAENRPANDDNQTVIYY